MAQTAKQQTGKTGEDIAVKHLVKHSFQILDRNYRKKWGEIDIIAKKDKIIHFIEVKSIRYEADMPIRYENHQPEENIHLWKRKRLARAIKTYLADKKISDETEWQVDMMAVFLDFKIRRAKIRMTENILL
jgi:putative endonuclease